MEHGVPGLGLSTVVLSGQVSVGASSSFTVIVTVHVRVFGVAASSVAVYVTITIESSPDTV